MDVIKAIESYPYYHSMTGQSREEWGAWRVQAVKEWMLDESILGKEREGNGSSESEPDHSSHDGILHVTEGDRGCRGRIGQYCVSDAARLSGEARKVREGMPGAGDSPGRCN